MPHCLHRCWDPSGNFTLVYEYQLRCGLTFPLSPFVQYTLACLHVAPGQVTPIMLRQILGTELMERLIHRVTWAIECRSSYRICRLGIYIHFGYARIPMTMPWDGGSRKKEGSYNKVSDENVLEVLLAEADHAKQSNELGHPGSGCGGRR
ncbi:hypothetical protein ACLB2K_077197 [Fragaria x ananassa]